jgi:hypothetical protein
MHTLTRTAGVAVAALAVSLGSLSAAQAQERVTVDDRLGQISQVEDAVPVADSPLAPVGSDGAVSIGARTSTAIALDLPVERSATVTTVDGRYVLPASDGASLAVAPTETGTQILVGIESDEAPTDYEFGLDAPDGFTPRVAADGGVEIANADGVLAAQIDSPWAVDAEGRAVPTRFEVRDGAVTQVVDHRANDVAYPIVADPKVKFCDWGTAVCMKLSKKETKKDPAGLAAGVVCAAAVAAYFYYLRGKFAKAKKGKKCVELKFRIIGPAVVTAKVLKC